MLPHFTSVRKPPLLSTPRLATGKCNATNRPHYELMDLGRIFADDVLQFHSVHSVDLSRSKRTRSGDDVFNKRCWGVPNLWSLTPSLRNERLKKKLRIRA